MKAKVKTITFVDFHEVCREVEEKFGFDFRDMAGKYSEKGRAARSVKWEELLESHGFGAYKHVLNKPEGSTEDWLKDSAEMAKRIEINKTVYPILHAWEEENQPYQDVWHYMIDHDFYDVSNGSMHTIYFNDLEEDAPDYVKKFYESMHSMVKDSPAYKDGALEVWVEW